MPTQHHALQTTLFQPPPYDGEDQSPSASSEASQPEVLRVPVFRVELVRERSFLAEPVCDSTAKLARLVASHLCRADREHFVVVMLATSLRVIGIHTAHVGTLNASLVCAREVFKPAILANAASIVVAHNHPSGCLEPSAADVQMTQQLVEAGELLEIQVLDALIVAPEGGYTSMAARGLLCR